MKKTAGFTLLLLILVCCSPLHYQAQFIEPHPRVDTKDHPIAYQSRQVYPLRRLNLAVDNTFDGARMNGCKALNDSTLNIWITAENQPINASPWYAFRLISSERKTIWIQLQYPPAVMHRYRPKVSSDRQNWESIDWEDVTVSKADQTAVFPVNLTRDTTWVAAQEIINSQDNYRWIEDISDTDGLQYSSYGTSVLGRPLYYLDICSGRKRGKPILVLLSRQHPPEITGYLALRSFLNRILDGSPSSKWLLKNYRILVYPMVNPDGVDLGHWRHNSGGVDLNRDWGSYRQPEIRQLCDHIVMQAKKNKASVVAGIDFHSTQKDIFYTNSRPEAIQQFQIADDWLRLLDKKLPNDDLTIEPSWVRPVSTSKNWFAVELRADGITYEVGDETPRDYIAKKATLAADALIETLQKQEIK